MQYPKLRRVTSKVIKKEELSLFLLSVFYYPIFASTVGILMIDIIVVTVGVTYYGAFVFSREENLFPSPISPLGIIHLFKYDILSSAFERIFLYYFVAFHSSTPYSLF